MTTPPQLPRTPDPVDGLRAGIDAHRQQIDAAKQAGAQARAEQQTPPTASKEQGA